MFSMSSEVPARSRVCRRLRTFIPEHRKDTEYWIKRRRNNEAAKRSREKRRFNDIVMSRRIVELTNENERLRMELETIQRAYGSSSASVDLHCNLESRLNTSQEHHHLLGSPVNTSVSATTTSCSLFVSLSLPIFTASAPTSYMPSLSCIPRSADLLYSYCNFEESANFRGVNPVTDRPDRIVDFVLKKKRFEERKLEDMASAFGINYDGRNSDGLAIPSPANTSSESLLGSDPLPIAAVMKSVNVPSNLSGLSSHDSERFVTAHGSMQFSGWQRNFQNVPHGQDSFLVNRSPENSSRLSVHLLSDAEEEDDVGDDDFVKEFDYIKRAQQNPLNLSKKTASTSLNSERSGFLGYAGSDLFLKCHNPSKVSDINEQIAWNAPTSFSFHTCEGSSSQMLFPKLPSGVPEMAHFDSSAALLRMTWNDMSRTGGVVGRCLPNPVTLPSLSEAYLLPQRFHTSSAHLSTAIKCEVVDEHEDLSFTSHTGNERLTSCTEAFPFISSHPNSAYSGGRVLSDSS